MSDGRVVIDSTLDTSSVERSLNDLQKNMEKAGDKMVKVGKNLSMKVTAPILGIGTAAVATTSKFDDSMSKVSAISGATGDDLEKLRDQAKELGSTTAFSASEAADAMGYLALAGWDTNKILAATPDMLNLASAGGMELAQAADIVSDTMSAFAMEAERAGEAADIFAAASSKSNTDVTQLGEAMKYAGAAASAAGMDLEQTSAILGILADSGIKGSMAGTTLNAMLRDIKKEATDGAIAIGETSVAVYDAEGNMRDLASILQDVELATEGMTGAQRDAALSNVFQEQSLRGVNVALQTGTESIKGLENELYNSSGAAESMADTMEDNLGGALRSMKSALEGLMIQIGEQLTPIITKGAEIVADLANRFGQLDDRTQKIIIVVAGLAAAIGPLLVIFGTMASSISKIIALKATLTAGMAATTTAATATAGATTGLGTALTVLTGPIGIAIGIIAALTAGIVYLWKTNEDFRAFVMEVWEEIKEFAVETFTLIKEVLAEVWKSIQETAKVIWNNLLDFWKQWGDTILEYAEAVWKNIKTVITTAIEIIADVINLILAAIRGDWSEVWGKVKSITSTLIGAIKTIISNSLDAILGIFSDILSKIWTAVKSTFNDMKNSVQEYMGRTKDTIENIWDEVMEFFEGIDLFQIGKDIITGLWNGIKNMGSTLKRNVSKFIEDNIPGPVKAILDIRSPSKVMEGLGEDTGEGFDVGLGNKIKDIASRAKEIAGSAMPNMSAQVAMAGNTTVNHSGTIRIEGVNDKGQMIDAVEILLEGINNPVGRKAVSRAMHENSKSRTRGGGR